MHPTQKNNHMSSAETTIFLRPRPYAKFAGTLTLLPLLPQPKPLKPLPSEIWGHIMTLAFARDVGDPETASWSWSVLTVCKAFQVSTPSSSWFH